MSLKKPLLHWVLTKYVPQKALIALGIEKVHSLMQTNLVNTRLNYFTILRTCLTSCKVMGSHIISYFTSQDTSGLWRVSSGSA